MLYLDDYPELDRKKRRGPWGATLLCSLIVILSPNPSKGRSLFALDGESHTFCERTTAYRPTDLRDMSYPERIAIGRFAPEMEPPSIRSNVFDFISGQCARAIEPREHLRPWEQRAIGVYHERGRRILKTARKWVLEAIYPDSMTNLESRSLPMIFRHTVERDNFPDSKTCNTGGGHRNISPQLPFGGVFGTIYQFTGGFPQFSSYESQYSSHKYKHTSNSSGQSSIFSKRSLDFYFFFLLLSVVFGFVGSLGGYFALDNQWRFLGTTLVLSSWLVLGFGLWLWVTV